MAGSELDEKRKRAEAALRASEERYRSLVESTYDSIYTVNREGKYLFANEKMLSVLGLPREKVVGRHYSAFLSGESAKEFDEKVKQVFENGKPVTYECRSKGDVWLLRTLSPIKDSETGEITAVTGITKSITELKQAGEALQKERDRAQMYLDVAGVALVVIDADQKVSLINKKGCDILGYNENEIICKNWFDSFIVERDRAEVKAVFDKLMTGEIEPVEYFENSVLTKSGEEKLLAWHNVPLKDEKGKILATISSGEDITERKRAEDQIKAALKEKEVLLREIHHRVKNNLQVVSSLLNLQARAAKDKGIKDILAESRNRINAMALIHSQLYENSDLSAINMKGFVAKLLGPILQSYPVQDTKITSIVHIDDYPLPIAIAVPLGLIVNELLSNAFKHAFVNRKEGKIEVVLRASEEGVVSLAVSDDGVGLPEGFDIKASERLGLHVVKILVEDQLEGNLEVVRDKGTTFKIEFKLPNE